MSGAGWTIAEKVLTLVFLGGGTWYVARQFWLSNKAAKIDKPHLDFPYGTTLKREKNNPVHVIYRLPKEYEGKWEVISAQIIKPKRKNILSLTGEGIPDGMGNFVSYHPVNWSDTIDFIGQASDGFLVSNDAPDYFEVRFKLSLKSSHKVTTFFIAQYRFIAPSMSVIDATITQN